MKVVKLIKDIFLYGVILPLILVVSPIFDVIFYTIRGILVGLKDTFSSTAMLYSSMYLVYKDLWRR